MKDERIALLCKGPSIANFKLTDIADYDKIGWANLHNLKLKVVPPKVDFLFIRSVSYFNQLSAADQRDISNLDIKVVRLIGSPAKDSRKRLTKFMNQLPIYIKNDDPFEFNASTGLVALNWVVDQNPKEIYVVGMDLFEVGKPVYYFDLNISLTSTGNMAGLKQYCDEEGILKKEDLHFPNQSLDYMYDLFKKKENIKIIYNTINENIKERFKDLPNVEVI